MGNCTSFEDDHDDCVLCHQTLKTQYVYCGFCETRVHKQCLYIETHNMNQCHMCSTENLRFINNRRESRSEKSFESVSLKSKRHTL